MYFYKKNLTTVLSRAKIIVFFSTVLSGVDLWEFFLPLSGRVWKYLEDSGVIRGRNFLAMRALNQEECWTLSDGKSFLLLDSNRFSLQGDIFFLPRA